VIRIVEVIIGVVLIYAGLDRFSTADQIKGVLYGVISIAGLVLAVHGILLFNVPGFF
jgi:Co/Zn/Cd efflux system component